MAESCYASGSYTFPKAKAAIVRALELDPSCGGGPRDARHHPRSFAVGLVGAEREIGYGHWLDPESTAVYMRRMVLYLCKGSER